MKLSYGLLNRRNLKLHIFQKASDKNRYLRIGVSKRGADLKYTRKH